MAVGLSESPYKHLYYPLNVYAMALQLEEGHVDYLHYGLFSRPDEELAVAQKRSTEMILSRLPKPPCRILEVGMGLGTTLKALESQGYSVTGITPDEHQVEIVRQRVGESSSIIHAHFETMESELERYDVILFQESGQYINTVDIFYKAFDLLVDGGQLIILDELALKYNKPGNTILHLEEHLLATARRSGFSLEEREDVSSLAIHTLDYMDRVLEKHRKPIMEALDLSERRFIDLMGSNRSYKKKYAREEFGYALLRFQKTKVPRWRVRNVCKENVSEVLKLFKSVFDEDMSLALWEWKYGEGRGQAILADREGQTVAHYGGMTRRIMYFGEPQLASQIGDVMVLPSERGVLTRHGPFFLTAATFPENYTGYGAKHLVGFGFPNGRAMKVAVRLGLYGEVGRMVEVSWSPSRFGWMPGTHARQMNPDKDSQVVNQLWSGMESDLKEALVGVRDWPFLRYRYFLHPHKKYEIFIVQTRLMNKPLGVIVLQKHTNGACELMDVISPLKHIPTLVNQARRVAGEWEMTNLYCWITEQNSSHFASAEGKVSPLDIFIPTSIWTDGPSEDELQGKWWLMSGDTDFR